MHYMSWRSSFLKVEPIITSSEGSRSLLPLQFINKKKCGWAFLPRYRAYIIYFRRLYTDLDLVSEREQLDCKRLMLDFALLSNHRYWYQ
jgi:hypothetical protein